MSVILKETEALTAGFMAKAEVLCLYVLLSYKKMISVCDECAHIIGPNVHHVALIRRITVFFSYYIFY